MLVVADVLSFINTIGIKTFEVQYPSEDKYK